MVATKTTVLFKAGTAPNPSVCLLCGTYSRDLISFPVTQQWFGAMLMCAQCLYSCVMENREGLGVVALSEYQDVCDELEKQQKINAIQESKVRNFEVAAREFRRVFDGIVTKFIDSMSARSGPDISVEPSVPEPVVLRAFENM